MSSETISLKKNQYSETVIRKALFWLSPISDWIFNENNEFWSVTILDSDNKKISHFNRLLNDQILREKIDMETRGIRREIIKKALADMEKSL